MKKKILFISEALWIGGIETALVNLLNRMDYETYDVTCLVVRGSLELAGRITPKCRLLVADREKAFTFSQSYRHSRLYHLTETPERPSRLHRAMQWTVPAIRYLENRLYIRYIRRQMAGERFHTCVIYSDRTAEIAVRAIRAEKYLLFYHHGAMRREYHDTIGYRRAEKIITVSERTLDMLKAFRPRYAHKMMAIHNIVDVEGALAKSREPLPVDFSADQFHIVSCGRVSQEKGMDLAVGACAELVRRGYDNIHWWIVGGGPAEEEVRREIQLLHMENHVTMLGMQENPYPYIAAADLYVQPSRYESFGLTIAEAMVLGKAVVSTDTDGASELIRDNKNGYLCSADGAAIADRIEVVRHMAKPVEGDSGELSERNNLAISRLSSLL